MIKKKHNVAKQYNGIKLNKKNILNKKENIILLYSLGAAGMTEEQREEYHHTFKEYVENDNSFGNLQIKNILIFNNSEITTVEVLYPTDSINIKKKIIDNSTNNIKRKFKILDLLNEI